MKARIIILLFFTDFYQPAQTCANRYSLGIDFVERENSKDSSMITCKVSINNNEVNYIPAHRTTG